MLIEESDLIEREKIIDEKNLEVQKIKQNHEEVLEDDILENDNEIINQRTSSLNNKIINIVSFIITFISGGIGFTLFKKWSIIHE